MAEQPSKARAKLTAAQEGNEAERSRLQRDRLLAAIHRLEGRLASAAPGRQAEWISKVIPALVQLQDGMKDRIASEDGLLADIELSAPQLWPRVQRLRSEYASLSQQVKELLAEFEGAAGEGDTDYRDVRERIGWLLTALKHQQAREVDLIFEVFNRDLGVGD